MGLTVKNKTSYALGDNLTEFFSLPIEEEQPTDEYSRLKEDIYSLDIDNEEKANILNCISILNASKSNKEKNKLKKEIAAFKEKYKI